MVGGRSAAAIAGTALALVSSLALPTSCSSFSAAPGDDAGGGDSGAPDRGAEATTSSPYESAVLGAKPALYWRLGAKTQDQPDLGSAGLGARASTGASLDQPSLVAEPADRSIRIVAGGTITSPSTPDWVSATRAYSIECWLRVDAAPIPADIVMRGSLTTGVGLFFDAAGKLRASRYENGVGATIGLTVPGPNVSHHVVVTYDGATLALFLDGTKDESAPETTSLVAASLPITVGASTPSARGPQLEALVDEIAIYDRRLDDEEIVAHARAGGIPAR